MNKIVKRIEKLVEIYKTNDAEELIHRMRDDIVILEEYERKQFERKINSELGLSRVGKDAMKRG